MTRSALGLLLIAIAAFASTDGLGVAPDGKPGFGDAPTRGAITKLFLDAEGEGRAFLADLLSLESDVRVLAALSNLAYRERGWLALVEPGETIERAFVRWRDLAREPFRAPMPPERARAFAELAADARAWTRQRLIAQVEVEARELRGALALMLGHARGRVDLQPGYELQLVATRADLAAARLRALRFDLSALHESAFAEPARARELAVEELARYLAAGDSRGHTLLDRLIDARELAKERITGDLASTRLEARVRERLEARSQALAEAEAILQEVLELVPHTPEGLSVGEPLASLAPHERNGRAVSTGLRGLARDPFHPLLNYWVARAHEFSAGGDVSRAFFDRFLVLRGIRHYDYVTFRSRDLTPEEEYALFAVIQWRFPDATEEEEQE